MPLRAPSNINNNATASQMAITQAVTEAEDTDDAADLSGAVFEHQN